MLASKDWYVGTSLRRASVLRSLTGLFVGFGYGGSTDVGTAGDNSSLPRVLATAPRPISPPGWCGQPYLQTRLLGQTSWTAPQPSWHHWGLPKSVDWGKVDRKARIWIHDAGVPYTPVPPWAANLALFSPPLLHQARVGATQDQL